MLIPSLLFAVGLLSLFGNPVMLWTLIGFALFVFFLLGWGLLGLYTLKNSKEFSWDVVLLTGLGLWGLLCFFSLLLGIWNPLFMGILCSLGALGWRLGVICPPNLNERTWWGIGFIALGTSLDVWGPMIDTDALYYHQALAKQMAIRGSLVGGWFEPNGSRPMLLHSVYAFVWTFLGEKGPSLCHWMISMALLGSVVERSKSGVWGLLLFISSWSVLQEIGVLSNNLPTALAIFLTWRMVCVQKMRIAAFFAFVALSFKLTSAGLLAGIWLLYISGVRTRLILACVVLLLFSIWPLRNGWESLSLLFPFSGWEEPFQHLGKYGMGRSWIDFLLLPWNVFVHAEIDSHQFQGRLSPMLLGCVLVIFRCMRRDLALLLIGFVFWAMGPQWLRHLILVFPFLVFTVGSQLRDRWVQMVLMLGFLVGLSSNWGSVFSRWSDSWEVLRGAVHKEDFLKEKIVGYEALRWVDRKLPKDSCPALAFVWGGSVLNRPYVLSSVEDHIPVRSWLRTYQKESFSVLPCDYIVVGKPAMNRNRYAFLSDEEYKKYVIEPISMLEELLLQQGVLIYTARGTRVYRIEKYVDKI
jgi:hypothetical protein